ncbi:unnamed protein product [Rodentolepis nana]|uniref:SET domain-containing protein n=1 Tax=Rodentolepis nana TaxID=102285 RepID=A0A0R3T5Y8_RODNA|nr:unnamed protein product [Rodentolepis nana]
MEAPKWGSGHKFVKEYFRIVNERMAKVGKKKEWLKHFGEAKTDFERVCYLLKSLEASNEDKTGVGVLGLPTKRDEVVKFNVKSDEFADKILLSLKTQKDVSKSLDYVNRALFFAESDAAKLRVLGIRGRLLSTLGELRCFRGEPPEVISEDSSKHKKTSHEKSEEVSCHLSASPNGRIQLRNTGNKRGWTLEVTQDVSVGDVLMVDKPYASTLLSDHFGTHCYHCYKRTLSLIPCHHCPYVGFCSETCAENASKDKLPASAEGTGRHVYDCHGIVACIILDNYAGWSKESKDSIGGPIVARLAFACVANTNPDTLLDYICSSGRYAVSVYCNFLILIQ